MTGSSPTLLQCYTGLSMFRVLSLETGKEGPSQKMKLKKARGVLCFKKG